MKESKIVSISIMRIIEIALCYLLLPIIIFFFGWLKLIVAVPLATMVALATVFFYRSQKEQYKDKKIEIELNMLIIAILALGFYVWISGIGRLSVSVYDSPWRDAIFNDLVNYSWPVKYPETGYNFVYYFTFWMVPALIGKLFGIFVGNIAIMIWAFIGLWLVFLLLNAYLGTEKKELVKYVLLLLLFYNGIKYLGMVYVQLGNIWDINFDIFQTYSTWLDGLYNGHAFNWYYRFNFDAVCEIFNQTPIVWLCTIFVLLNSKKIENYAYIGIICFAYAPVAFLGLFTVLLFMGIFIDNTGLLCIKNKILSACSPQNVLACLSILVPLGLFYKTNTNAGGVDNSGIMLLPLNLFGKREIVSLLVCYLVEFGIYAIILFKEQKKNPIYYIILFTLAGSAFIEFGHIGSREVNMNATLPSLFILMVMLLQFIRDNIVDCKTSTKGNFLIVCLVLAALTPAGHMLSKIDTIIDAKKVPIENSWVETYSDKRIDVDSANCFSNFLVKNDKTLFTKIEKTKTQKSIENDLIRYQNYKKGKNEIIEGEYYIKAVDSDKYLRINDDGIEMSTDKAINKVIIVYGKSVIQSMETGNALDVPNGEVDEYGTIGAHRINNSVAQQYGIISREDSYTINYGEFVVCRDEDGHIRLEKNDGAVNDNELWEFVRIDK